MPRNIWILTLFGMQDSSSQKKTISKAAKNYSKYFKVPLNQRFSNDDTELPKFSHFLIIRRDNIGEFGGIELKDKLLIIAHGSPEKICVYTPQVIAEKLFQFGLRKVGVVSFKACDIGSGSFLTEFLAALEAKKVDVGWAKGYTGGTKTVHSYPGSKPSESVRNKKLITADSSGQTSAQSTQVQVVLAKGNAWKAVPEPKTVKLKRLKLIPYSGKFEHMSFSLDTSPDQSKPVPLTANSIPADALKESGRDGDPAEEIELNEDGAFKLPIDDE